VISGGSQIFTGANSYSGTTTINSDATLQVGNGGAVGTLGTGAVTNNGTLTFNRSNVLIVSNAIGGNGSLIQVGAGTVILESDNTYAGITTINSGATLQIGFDDATGTLGNGAVINNGVLRFSRADAIIVANSIGGSGSLINDGYDNVILTGTNTYTGTTTINNNGGTSLQIGNDGTTGTLGSGAVINNSFLIFYRSDSITVSNNISGSGIVNPISGIVTLTGLNTYSGGTRIGGGTLSVSSGGISGTNLSIGEVTINGGTLLLNTNGNTISNAIVLGSGTTNKIAASSGISAILSGEISGSSASAIFGISTNSGTVILTGSNTYTGTSTINVGTLQIGNGGTSGALASGSAISIASGAVLSYNLSTSNTSLRNVISGAGTIGNIALGTTLNLSGATLSGFSTATYQVNVDETSVQPTYAKITLGANPSLGGNTFKVLTTGYQSSFDALDVFSWSGTATGTPTLNLNGTTVSSGSSGSGGTLTYYTNSRVTLSASNKTNDVVTDSATGENSSGGSTYSNVNKLLTTSLSMTIYQGSNVTGTTTPSAVNSGLVIDAGALQKNLITEMKQFKSKTITDLIATEFEMENNLITIGAI
jgi:autotransporter-associated beta strand protein